MKRLFAVLFIFVILFHVSACKAEQKESHQPTEQSFTEPENYEGSSPVVSENSFSAFGDTLEFQLFEKTEFYELYGQVHGTATYYEIFNTQGDVIDFGFYESSGGISQVGKLLEYSMTCGTCCRWVKYFDVENSRVSAFFNNPLALHEEMVIYTAIVDDVHCFVIQNVFGGFEQIVEIDPKPNSAVQFQANFLDGEHVQVTYSTDAGEYSTVYEIRMAENNAM